MNTQFWKYWVASLLLCFGIFPAAAQTITNLPSLTNQWHGNVSLGLTITRGNSDTLLASATAATQRKWLANDLSLGADALYGESKLAGATGSQETADRAHAFSQYNRLFSERLYGYARLEALYDGIADIEYRFTATPGAGYYFIKNKKMDFSVEGGPGYIVQKLDDESLQYMTLRLAEKFNYIISPHAKLWETAEILPQVDNFENYIVNAELGIESALTKKISLRAVLDDNYNNVPAPGRLKNDLKLITSIVYKF